MTNVEQESVDDSKDNECDDSKSPKNSTMEKAADNKVNDETLAKIAIPNKQELNPKKWGDYEEEESFKETLHGNQKVSICKGIFKGCTGIIRTEEDGSIRRNDKGSYGVDLYTGKKRAIAQWMRPNYITGYDGQMEKEKNQSEGFESENENEFENEFEKETGEILHEEEIKTKNECQRVKNYCKKEERGPKKNYSGK